MIAAGRSDDRSAAVMRRTWTVSPSATGTKWDS